MGRCEWMFLPLPLLLLLILLLLFFVFLASFCRVYSPFLARIPAMDVAYFAEDKNRLRLFYHPLLVARHILLCSIQPTHSHLLSPP